MPTFTNPRGNAEEARQALRSLAHATRTVDDPADVYDVLGAVTQALASMEQTLHQLGTFHDNLQRRDIRPVVADSLRGGRSASYQVSWELNRAAEMARQVGAAVSHAHELEARISYSRPIPDLSASSATTTPGLSL
ncbi:hypothetical protein NBCG_01607 [Nocardioidaceae bacterium Broad-1]|nr:hypothetical protein NBCG_01607 [Nocardioidaceae bacterium Broad-1]